MVNKDKFKVTEDRLKEKNFIFQSFCNLRFLERYRKMLNINPNMTLKEFEDDWNKVGQIPMPNKALFNANLYPLLIYPKEAFFDCIPDIRINEINEKFDIEIIKDDNHSVIKLRQLLRRMRNSIVHNRMDDEGDYYIFCDSLDQDIIDFEMKISFKGLADFIVALMDNIVFSVDIM